MGVLLDRSRHPSRDERFEVRVRLGSATVCRVVIDAAGDLAARAGLPFEDYTEAVRGLPRAGPFPVELARELERLPGFRNVLIHEYVAIDLERVVAALDELGPIEEFADRLAEHLAE